MGYMEKTFQTEVAEIVAKAIKAFEAEVGAYEAKQVPEKSAVTAHIAHELASAINDAVGDYTGAMHSVGIGWDTPYGWKEAEKAGLPTTYCPHVSATCASCEEVKGAIERTGMAYDCVVHG